MPTLIRKTTPACRNLPRHIGSHPVEVVRHTSGPLAGHTTLSGHALALRVPPGSGWRPLEEAPEKQGRVEEGGDVIAWAKEIVAGTVSEVRGALTDRNPADYTQAHVAALLEAEEARGPRVGAMTAIQGWAEGVLA